MSDEIPNDQYTRECPNDNCRHMNLPWRMLCAICGYRLHPVVENLKCRICQEPIEGGNICGTCVNLNAL